MVISSVCAYKFILYSMFLLLHASYNSGSKYGSPNLSLFLFFSLFEWQMWNSELVQCALGSQSFCCSQMYSHFSLVSLIIRVAQDTLSTRQNSLREREETGFSLCTLCFYFKLCMHYVLRKTTTNYTAAAILHKLVSPFFAILHIYKCIILRNVLGFLLHNNIVYKVFTTMY